MSAPKEYRFLLDIASMTDTGQIRSHNEDSIVVSAECGLAILADGMGGYNAGEVASSMATSTVQQVVQDQLKHLTAYPADDHVWPVEGLLNQAILAANSGILDAASAEPEYSGMGTTIVMALFHHDIVTIAHVGDSRAYRLRDQQLTQLTRDHSLLQEQVDAGLISPEQARFAQHKNLITRAVGVDLLVQPDTNEFALEPGDLYVLCSDGLSDMIDNLTITETLNLCGDDVTKAVENLVAQANQQGGRDNISVILIRVFVDDSADKNFFGRFRQWIN